MNYLFVLHTINCGGAEKYIINLANALSQLSNEDKVWLYVFDDSKFYLNLIAPTVNLIQNNNKQSKSFSLRWYLNFYLMFGIKLSWQTRKIKYDYIISGYEELSEIAISYVHLSKLFRKHNIKYVSFIHNTFRYFKLRKKTVLHSLKSKILDTIRRYHFNRFFVVSDQIEGEFIEKYPNKQCTILYPILNKSEKYANEQKVEDKLQKPYLISIGRINKTKNQKLLVNVFEIIKNSKVNLYIYGNSEDHSYFKELSQQVQRLGLEKRVKISQSAVTEINKYLSNAEALVVTSKNEGFPLNIIEAMNFNIPIISTPFPGSSYLEGKGLLLKTFDVKELAETIDELLNNKFIYDKEMQNNVSKFLEQFRRQRIVNEFKKSLE